MLKQNLKKIILLIALLIILNTPINYYIHFPGGIDDTNQKVTVENEYNSKGSFNITFVSQAKATIGNSLLTFILPNWDLIKNEEIILTNEDYEDAINRNKILLNEANNNAIIAALNELDIKYTKENPTYEVIYIDPNATTTIKVGDEITKLENKTITSIDHYSEILKDYNINDEVTITTNNGQKVATVYQENNKNITGLYIAEIYDIKTKQDITFNFDETESGPSGGLMMALTIYNKLTEDDLTNNQKIAGTGTINQDGTVGPIDGIKYKLAGAEKENVDIFLVPTENIEEAINLKDTYTFKIIEAKNLNQVIKELKKLK